MILSNNQFFNLSIFFTLIVFFIIENAHAEGNCPSGYYPIGGQGVQGCAPISSGGSGGYSNQYPALNPLPETLWGAIAEDKSNGLKGRPIGFTRNFKSKDEAQAKAMKACQQDGGQKCQVSQTYSSRCVAVADPIKDGQISKILLAFSEEQAKKGALVFCLSENLEPCRIVYSGCSLGD
ncbi:DUF4189 domain-containing protein [Acinetobacter sp.]|jgi:hypothetical protein|uniref:DUF4189 domain-containing protein n=1 Tax=Acinetobacter sp. TaxID=472 RepID=UPI0028312576|nr:DUF4189 domain-containing protein [Acinetobacter sp.]MDR0238052.1 DUF4189 domain-containing protein [Acinetobacter sp.]MDR2277176.1 DUF4189 domain-containing protein [Vagococcus sp.]